jgi:hypothetical protein
MLRDTNAPTTSSLQKSCVTTCSATPTQLLCSKSSSTALARVASSRMVRPLSTVDTCCVSSPCRYRSTLPSATTGYRVTQLCSRACSSRHLLESVSPQDPKRKDIGQKVSPYASCSCWQMTHTLCPALVIAPTDFKR